MHGIGTSKRSEPVKIVACRVWIRRAGYHNAAQDTPYRKPESGSKRVQDRILMTAMRYLEESSISDRIV
jgi:L-amino acid N-acyltransferase YncA